MLAWTRATIRPSILEKHFPDGTPLLKKDDDQISVVRVRWVTVLGCSQGEAYLMGLSVKMCVCNR